MTQTVKNNIKDDNVSSNNIILKLEDISKTFGHVKANQDINIEVQKGTIHGIIGENGAGKSTLMNIIYGFYHADAGHIYIDGKKRLIHNSLEAIGYGIGMVHQHFMLVQTFSVIENIVLGAEDGFMTGPTLKHARENLAQLSEDYGLHADPDALIEDLPVGARQRVEILKALYRKAKILILDEPTGALTPQEANKLFEILDALRQEGVTIILITHKLREIMAITDTVSVMHRGRMVAHRYTSETNVEELAELMVGRKVRLDIEKSIAKPGKILARVNDVSIFDDLGVERLKSVNMQIREGEIVGIAGVSGNGQTELIEALAGMLPIQRGVISIMGHDIRPTQQISPAQMRAFGVGHIPEDRLKHGIIKNFSAEENAILGFSAHSRWNNSFHILHKKIRSWCLTLMDKWDVRPRDTALRSADFSGGNQQKLIIGREIEENPKLILIGQPTRGVDIGAIESIHKSLIEQRDKGCGILLISVELDEVMSIADRILVMFEGRIVGEVDAAEANERNLGLMMANAHTTKRGRI